MNVQLSEFISIYEIDRIESVLISPSPFKNDKLITD